jgi:hypothetical protein
MRPSNLAIIARPLTPSAKSCLVKGALPEQILETVRRVAGGAALVPTKIASTLTESMTRPELTAHYPQMTQMFFYRSADYTDYAARRSGNHIELELVLETAGRVYGSNC